MAARRSSPRLRIAFIHPDLGLGGAERLVVDACQQLIAKGHHVDMFTSHYDSFRCFEETKKFNITVHGSNIPRHLFGAGHIFFSMLRNAAVAFSICTKSYLSYDVFFCDQVSVCHWLIRMLQPKARIYFYCHFPDQLLSQRTSLLKRLYRLPFDITEEVTTGMADQIVCNSGFTRGVFRDTFRLLRGVHPAVLHPCVDVNSISGPAEPECYNDPDGGQRVFLSINRFERKKNIDLAVLALAHLRDQLGKGEFENVHLVVAGGYDKRVQENVEYFEHLVELTKAQGLSSHVHFIRSFTDEEKNRLLAQCIAVLYTPDREHFGIVPLECMAASRPVIAVASGGPLESIKHEETGFLCEGTAESFGDAMHRLATNRERVVTMGAAARAHVEASFSRAAFGNKLEEQVVQLHNSPVSRRVGPPFLFFISILFILLMVAMLWLGTALFVKCVKLALGAAAVGAALEAAETADAAAAAT